MGRKILVVDDSRDLRYLLVRFLQSQGYDTAEAENGKIALEYLEQNPRPDLVLLDSEMDVMTGAQFLAELERSHPELLGELPIIVLTGSDKFAHPRIFRSMRKPVDLGKLGPAISLAISSSSSALAAATL